MPNAVALREYDKLVDDISVLYEDAKKAQVRFAWETGKRIVEVEQNGAVRAEYGSGLIPKLSQTLSRKYGNGFSETNLEDMRRFYVANKNSRPAGKLGWTIHLALSRVRDLGKRRALEQRAIRGGLRRDDVRKLVREAVGTNGKPAKPLPPLIRPKDLKLNTFRLAKPEVAALRKVPKGKVLIDCGFFSYLPVDKTTFSGEITETPAWTYAVEVLRVIDGDTVVVVFTTLGSDKVHEEKFRLRGINTPELGTPEGEKAKAFVQKLLPAGSLIVVKSKKSTDPHGRFVVDLFYSGKDSSRNTLRPRGDQQGARAEGYLKPNSAPEEIIAEGVYLNQQLLDEGYAVRMEE
jgi:endonuclease YncB( thermonuclease family)